MDREDELNQPGARRSAQLGIEPGMTDRTVALITGANKGLGFEIARQLGKKEISVVVGARDPAKGEEAAASLRKEGIDAHFVQLDVTNGSDVAALRGFFDDRFGRLDILVNNAGVGAWGKEGVEHFRTTFEANVFGAVAVTYAVLPLLKRSPSGRVVNQSSILGSLTTLEKSPDMFGNFVDPAYTASKSALNGFTVALANKLRGTNLKVNSAHPGWVKTDMGGEQAPMHVTDGAKTAVALATLAADGPSGEFFHLGDHLPW